MTRDLASEACCPNPADAEPKLYKTRWLLLAFYILYAAVNAFQWFEYSIITNVVTKYYNVSSVAVDWTSVIYMALYMPMVIPASYIMEKIGLRYTAVVGVLGTGLGTILKVFSLQRDRIWVTYLAQTILSSMQVFILALPSKIAAVWFGPNEASLACALGVFGTQIGQALGFIVPPMVVKDHDDVELIGEDLEKLVKSLAWIALFASVAVMIYFPEQPPTPPVKSSHKNNDFISNLKDILACRSFRYHLVAYGISIAVFVSISTLLNQFMLHYFPNSEEDAGRLGLIMVVLGMVGAIAFGYILDKTHKYKTIALVLYVSSLLSLVAFMFCLEANIKIFVYISGSLLGLCINAYMLVGLELGVELTYPQPESTSSGILISMTQTLGVLFTLLLGWLFSVAGCFWALASMLLFLLIGAIFTARVSNVTRRQSAFIQSKIIS